MYAEVRGRVAALVRAAEPSDWERSVPATPRWTVRQVLSHLAGVTADVVAGNIAGAATDGWTAVQVADRADRDVESLLAEWEENSAIVEGLLDQVPQAGLVLADAAAHEQDLAAALGVHSGRGSSSYDAALQMFLSGVDDRLLAAGLAVSIKAGDDEWVLGTGDPVAVTAVDQHEVFRAVSGRRTLEEIKAWAWEGDSAAAAHLPAFPPPPAPLGEQD